MVWFKAVSINKWQRVVDFGSGGTDTILFSNYDNDPRINLHLNPGNLRTVSVSTVSLNTWVHLTATFTTTSGTVYFNGSVDATLTGMILKKENCL